MKSDNQTSAKTRNGVKLNTINYTLAAVTLAVSAVMLIAIFQIAKAYRTLTDSMDEYMEWQKNINDMQIASDYLTEQSRLFVENGNTENLNNYFTESNESKRRENALENLKGKTDDAEMYKNMTEAMELSMNLMETELYAMRLKAESIGMSDADLPEEIQDVVLKAEDREKTAAEKDSKARDLLFNNEYLQVKRQILSKTTAALESVHEEIQEREGAAAERLRYLINNEQVLIVALIVIVIGVVALTAFQVINPLVKAIRMIEDHKLLPIKGTYEMRFLAKTYNQMYEANNKREKQLRYDASHDYLTGLYNRAGLENKLKAIDIDSSTLIIMDTDRFKSVNDTYGHEIGDRLLKKLADTIRDSFRQGDIICRYGGDEFIILLGKSGKSDKEWIALRIEEINRKLADVSNGLPASSVSAGIAFGKGETTLTLFEKADRALYLSKEGGRKAYTFFENDGESDPEQDP